MSATETEQSGLTRRPKRADARRNYDKLIAAGREAFTERDTSASLEDIARRAGVGIGTLYRHFPTRTDLIEAVYVEEVEALCRSADDLTRAAAVGRARRLAAPLHRLRRHQARACRGALRRRRPRLRALQDLPRGVLRRRRAAPRRAQEAGAVRPDVSIDDVVKMVGGIAKIQGADPATIERILGVALDGLRPRAT